MKKNQLKKLAVSLTAVLFTAAVTTGCSVLDQAPTANEESGLHSQTETANDTKDEKTGAQSAHHDSSGQNRLEQIKSRGYIEIATEPYFAPNEFIDPSKNGNEKYVGSDIELAKYIAGELGVECRIVPLDFTSVLSSVTEGKYDMAISALSYTPARAEAMELSKGYYFDSESVQYGLMVRNENLEAIKSVDDLAGKSIVVQSGSIQEMFANEQVPSYGELKRVSATTDGFLMVQEKKVDSVITAVTTAQLYIDANEDCGMSIVPGLEFVVDEATQGERIGIPKGEKELLEEVNAIIDDVTKQGLYTKWYQEYKEYARSLGL